MMNDKLFTGYAELTPSYRKILTGEHSPPNDEQNKAQKGGPRKQLDRPTYVPDMAEPKTFLSRILPQILQLILPSDFSATLRRVMIESGILESNVEVTDREILQELGVTVRAKTGSKYSFECKDGALRLVYVSEQGVKQFVSGKGFDFLICTICTAIINDLSVQLRKAATYTSLEFKIISRKITYNPFAKVAALLPITAATEIPTIVGLLLMDQKMSLVTLSLILRTAVLPKTLKDKYNLEKSPDLAVRNFTTHKGVPSYDFLVADGTYEFVRVKFDGKVSVREIRPVRHDKELTEAPIMTDDMW